MDDATVEKAWRTHWLAVARCGENGPISAHDIERSGFHAGYAAAITAFLADLEARGLMICPVCEDCPPRGYPTDKTRCSPCPRRTMTDAPSCSGER
jgi:hypothetical protein